MKHGALKLLQLIVDFADIKQCIDTPLFTYSSGMKLRQKTKFGSYPRPT